MKNKISWRMRYGRQGRQERYRGKGEHSAITGSTVLRHEIKPKMGEISNSEKF